MKEKKIPLIVDTQGRKNKRVVPKDVVPTLRKETHGNIPMVVLSASGPATTTRTQTSRTTEGGQKASKRTIQATLGESLRREYPTTISFVQDFLASRFPSLGSGKVSRTSAEMFSSRYPELRRLKDLRSYSLKTLKGYYRQRLESAVESIEQLKEKEKENLQAIFNESRTNPEEAGKKLKSLLAKATASSESLNPFSNWGVVGSNGRFLTASTMGFRRVGPACSLSDILQPTEEVDEKYFLSSKATKWLAEKLVEDERNRLALRSTRTTGREATSTGSEP